MYDETLIWTKLFRSLNSLHYFREALQPTELRSVSWMFSSVVVKIGHILLTWELAHVSVLQPARGLDVAPVLSWLEAGHNKRGCRGHQGLLLLLGLWQPPRRLGLVHPASPLESSVTLVRGQGQAGGHQVSAGWSVLYRGNTRVRTQSVLAACAHIRRLRPGTGGVTSARPLVTRGGPAEAECEVTRHARVIWK